MNFLNKSKTECLGYLNVRHDSKCLETLILKLILEMNTRSRLLSFLKH